MTKVIPIGPVGVTPDVLLDAMKKDITTTTGMVAVVFESGDYKIHASCSRSELALAGAAIQQFFQETNHPHK